MSLRSLDVVRAYFHAKASEVYSEPKKLRSVAQGDDFAVLQAAESLDCFRDVVQHRMEVKFQGRLEGGEPRAVRDLSRIVKLTGNGLGREVDESREERAGGETY